MDIWTILTRYRVEWLLGLMVTLRLCAWIWGLGLIFGTAFGVAGARWPRLIGWPSRMASFVLASIPILVFLFWLHYPLQAYFRVVIDPFVTAIAALTTVNTLLVADIIRDALRDFPNQYITAARVSGLKRRQIVLHIQLPLIFRQVLPSILSTQVLMLQSSLFASLISVDEIFRIAQRINSEVYRPIEIYTALAILFIAVCLPLHGLAQWLRARYTRDFSEL